MNESHQFAWSGLSRDLGAEFKVICSRSSEPLGCAAKLTISEALWSLSVHVRNLKIYYVLGSGIYEFPNVSHG
jgi:hypothetical protein